MSERKEWVNVRRQAKGGTTLTVSLVEDNASVKWAIVTFGQGVKTSLAQARREANKALDDLLEAMTE